MAQTDPENARSKKKQFFWFSFKVLHGFSRKSNEDEFPRESNEGGNGYNKSKENTRSKKKKEFFMSSLGVLHRFYRKSNESDDDLNKSRKHKEQKKSI